MKALLFAFDCLTRRDFDSSLPGVSHEVDKDEGLAVGIVRSVKNGQPLGDTIKARTNFIARIIRGGVADHSGYLNSGDQLVEVNGVNVVGKKPADVVKLLNSSSDSVTFKLIPAPAQLPTNGFSCSDSSGCENASLVASLPRFLSRRDVLRLCDLSDDSWWQAKLCHSSNEGNVGLVPSSKLLKSIDEAKRAKDVVACSGFGTSRRFRSAPHDAHLLDEPTSDVLKAYQEGQRVLVGLNLSVG
ncbi:hypothetical protein M514_10777 [Trichuris suis]|uniref:PDZ domain-containing protein n=2 Tax=Trichuris suis TaxID=68888 RepID=A0A085MYJ0_9BILA|nr:hypothetical protein M514_10777 [Trichuris suis]